MLETAALQQDATAVAYQAATLAARHAKLWIARAHVFVGMLQLAAVIYGIRGMNRVNSARAAASDNQRHAESMAALQALIDGMETVIERTGCAPAR